MSREQEIVRQIAEDYTKRGYMVNVEPSEAELPAFLKGYRPNIIAQSPNGSVVIEVKSKTKPRPLEYWAALADIIQKQPNWSFEMVLNEPWEREAALARSPVLGKAEIEARLQEGQRLAEAGFLDSALLITWAATEAALRWAGQLEEAEPPPLQPMELIGSLYADGVLAEEDYDFLKQVRVLRNAAVHGFRAESIDSTIIDRTQRVARKLLKRYGSKLAA